jgi:hypothetical protein
VLTGGGGAEDGNETSGEGVGLGLARGFDPHGQVLQQVGYEDYLVPNGQIIRITWFLMVRSLGLAKSLMID